MALPDVVLVSNGDMRKAANEKCWPMQQATLKAVVAAFAKIGVTAKEVTLCALGAPHRFLSRQADGLRLFAEKVDPHAMVVIVLSCWAYAHHVASALKNHKGPILILANFDGTWPGLVALLNHSATLERMAIVHSRIWSDNFENDPEFMRRLATWIETGKISYDSSCFVDASELSFGDPAILLGKDLAADIRLHPRLMGQLDPGTCMGMLNALMDPGELAAIGFPLEGLSQSDLVAEMGLVPDPIARGHYEWLRNRGANFHFDAGLTEQQVLLQMKMYDAGGQLHHRWGLSALGVPYQPGLMRCVPASDLPEGMWNNPDRPDIIGPNGVVIACGSPIVHFNEGDIGAGIIQVVMGDIAKRCKLPLANTLHDVRWGLRLDNGRWVWVLLISGGAPAEHFGGWPKTHIYRQAEMYFGLGGGTCSGVSHPGIITWGRAYQDRKGRIGVDAGLGEVQDLERDFVADILKKTTSIWPVANTWIPGYDRDALMANHMSNHITIGFGDMLDELVCTFANLGVPVRVAHESRRVLRPAA